MRTVMWKVFFTISVLSVKGIRVPTSWNDAETVNHRFSRRNDGPDTVPEFAGPYQSQNIQPQPQMLFIVPQIPSLRPKPLKGTLDNRYQSESQLAQINIPHKKYYQQIPDKILGVQPLGVVDKYQQLKEAQRMQEMVNSWVQQYNPGLFRQQPDPLSPWALSQHTPQNHLLQASASEEDATLNPLGFKRQFDRSTRKEPVFFVTEGYRNVLLQGPHNKKKYMDEQKPLQKRKVTKIYRIHNDLDGSSKNLVEPDAVKPRYFQRPSLYDNEEKRLGLQKHLRMNYRDDTLHEPKDDKDFEREDNEDERIPIEGDKGAKDDKLENEDLVDEDATKEVESQGEANNEAKDVVTNDKVDSEKDEVSVDKIVEDQKEVVAKEDNTNATTPKNDAIHDAANEPKSISNVQVQKNVETETATEENKLDSTEKTENKEEASDDTQEEQTESNEEDDEENNEADEEDNKQVPHSEHADPKLPPTKPIYPGEGAWAKPGFKHRPHVSQHRFLKPAEEEQKPNGYSVSEDLERFFDSQKDNFGDTFQETTTTPSSPFFNYFESIRTPSPVNPLLVYDPFTESSNKNSAEAHTEPIKATSESPITQKSDISSEQAVESNEEGTKASEEDEEENEELEENDESEDDDSDEFVPLKLYTQVRNHEDVEHEPYNPLEHGRLREVIKDSKVQTVYTEEGYEDAAYDHAGHEKNAEKDQGYSEFEREKEGQGKEDVKADVSDSDEGLSKQVPVLNEPEHVLIDSLASDTIVPKEDPDNKKSQNFISTQEVKTTQVKDKPNGNMELEIESEVKVIMQPNNSSESHKYVKIFPKVLKEIENDAAAVTEEYEFGDPSTTESSTVSEIESITKPYKPKVVVKAIDESGALKTIIGEDKFKRSKRSVELSPFGGFDTDLSILKKINHTFEPAKPEVDVEKYPYYVLPGLNEDSPLRYAENLDNIPKKTEGELTFYNLADKHECPEIPQSIDPIPEHVKNAHLKKGEEDESEEAEYEDNEDEDESVVDKKRPATPKTPRIQLGDKIDCLKARYFGENPLDSPFFKEETVGPVKPIFKDLDHTQKSPVKNVAAWRRSDDNVVNTNEVFDETEKVTNKAAEKAEAAESINLINRVKVNDVNEAKPTASPLVTLITTPKYTIQLTPKNIYDQIKLLDHLPEDEASTTEKTVETTVKSTQENESSQKEESSEREPKVLVDVEGPEAEALRRKRTRPRRPAYQIFDVNRFLTTTPFNLINSASSTVLPKHKVLSEVYYKDEIKPSEQLNVFADVLNNIKNSSKMETVPMQSASDFAEPSAVTIKTLEESTVVVPRVSTPSFVRVKKFQSDSSYSRQNTLEVPKTTLRPPAPTRKIPLSYNFQKPVNNNQVPVRRQPYVATQDFRPKVPLHSTTSTSKPFRPSQPIPKQPTTTVSPKRKLLKRRRKPLSTTTTTTTLRTTTNIHVPKQSTPSNHQPYVIDFIEDTDKVVGLVPPQNFEYRTIIVRNSENRDGLDDVQSEPPQSIPVTEPTDEAPPKKPLNTYLYPGLRPPAPQKVRSYSDYLVNGALVNENLLRRRVAHIGHLRAKRDAARQSYADLSRNRGRQSAGLEESSVADDDVDDYVPHRPKNYHYDEKTGKIIYHNKPKPKEEEEDVEYEEIEIPDTRGAYLERAEDATHPTPEKVTTKQLLATATPPPEGQGLLDFVLKLKQNPKYEFIPDPTTPKPGSKPSTTEGFTTVDPQGTNPPEFLSILSKVKSDSSYKYIEDPKESKTKLKASTPAPEDEAEEDEEEEESVPQHFQNAPGGQAQDLGNIEIFDIGDYLPKIKPLAPRTSIDYSKYKTIQRNHPKTTPSTLEDEEEELVAPRRREEVLIKQDHSRETTPKPTQRRKNIGERYKGAAIQRPEVDREEESIDRLTYSEEVVTEKPATTTTTTQRIVQLRRGTRPTTTRRTTVEVFEAKEATTTARSRRRPVTTRGTRRPATVSSEAVTEKVAKVYPANYSSDFTDQPQSASFEKAKRVYRRRPVRIRHTTERQENDDEVDKIVRRSVDNKFDFVKDEFEKASLEDTDNSNTYQAIRTEILNEHYPYSLEYQGEYDDGDDDASESDLDQTLQGSASYVDIIDPSYDEGNYGEGNDDNVKAEVDEINSPDLESAVSQQQHVNYKHESMALVNDDAESTTHPHVEVYDPNYNRTDPHGGNYKHESMALMNDAAESTTQHPHVEVYDPNYNRTDPHGGNYKHESMALVNDAAELTTQHPHVEVYDPNYNRTDPHGGNYKHESMALMNDAAESDPNYNRTDPHGGNYKHESMALMNDAAESTTQHPHVEVYDPNYNRTDPHGGNYKHESMALINDAKFADTIQQDVEVINPNFNRTTKHGGNYKSDESVTETLRSVDTEDDSDTDNSFSISAQAPQTTRRRLRIRKRPSITTEQPSRLSDVVPKPDHFYSDPRLPEDVNKLMTDRSPVKLQSEEVSELAQVGDDLEEVTDERPRRRRVKLTRRKLDGASGRDETETKVVVTKKPVFEKDPSKRLYYYVEI